MVRPRRAALALLALAGAVGLVVAAGLSFPSLTSAYHLEAGGRALDSARPAGGVPARGLWHLEKAVQWDDGNAQAYRLLARARQWQRDWPGAVAALTRYVALRPENHLAQIELAELYEDIRADVEGGEAGRYAMPPARPVACDDPGPAGALEPLLGSVELTCLAVQAWQQAGYTPAGLVEAGQEAQAAGRADEALAWFRRAIDLAPESGDGWYYLGLWYEGQQQWPQAAAAYEQALALNHLALVPESDVALQAGLVHQLHLAPPSLDRAVALYETALAADQFSRPGKAADCYYRRGEIWQIQGRPVEEYAGEFERAVALNPGHAWAHARLGSAIYLRDGDAVAAEAELREGIRLSPGSKWMYVMLGDVYRREGRAAEARTVYDQALALDPGFEEARDRLQAIDGEP